MKLIELLEAEDEGLFMAVHFTEETLDDLVALGETLGLENVTARNDFHTTIIFSKKYINLPPITHDVKIDPATYSWELFGHENNVLVLKYESPELKERFDAAMELGATYDFDEYKPHVTFAFDVENIDLDDLDLPTFSLQLAEEYQTPLDLDWKDKR